LLHETRLKSFLPIGRARPVALLISALLGAAGWAFLALATYSPGFGPESPAQPDVLAFAMFLIVILAARAMATRLLPDTAVALDSGFYVAATLCLGSVASGRMVALALTVDSVWRLAHARHEGGPDKVRLPEAASLIVYFGGMTGALLTLAAWFFDVDSLAVRAGAAEKDILLTVAGTGAVFLLAHYTIQGVRLAFLGERTATYLRRMALPALRPRPRSCRSPRSSSSSTTRIGRPSSPWSPPPTCSSTTSTAGCRAPATRCGSGWPSSRP
jgi:hypothetical protein